MAAALREAVACCGMGEFIHSVVQWHHFFFFCLVAASLKMDFPKKGSFFSRVTEQLSLLVEQGGPFEWGDLASSGTSPPPPK